MKKVCKKYRIRCIDKKALPQNYVCTIHPYSRICIGTVINVKWTFVRHIFTVILCGHYVNGTRSWRLSSNDGSAVTNLCSQRTPNDLLALFTTALSWPRLVLLWSHMLLSILCRLHSILMSSTKVYGQIKMVGLYCVH